MPLVGTGRPQARSQHGVHGKVSLTDRALVAFVPDLWIAAPKPQGNFSGLTRRVGNQGQVGAGRPIRGL